MIRYWQKRNATLQRIHESLRRPPISTAQPEGASGLRVRIAPYHVRKIVEELTTAEPVALPPATQETDEPEDPLPATRAIEFHGSLTVLAVGVQAISVAQVRTAPEHNETTLTNPNNPDETIQPPD